MKEITGIVIRVTPFRESDAMVTVLGEERIHSFLARGVMKMKSKNSSSVNLYNKSRFTITSSKDGLVLRSGEVLNSFERLRTDLNCLLILDFMGEVTNKLIINEDAPEAYKWLDRCLDVLNIGNDPISIALIYLAAVLRINGNGLEVDSCVICYQKKPIVGVNYHLGGFICVDDLSRVPGSKRTSGELKILRYLFKVHLESVGKTLFTHEEAHHILKDLGKFIEEQLDVTLKSIPLIEKVN